MLSVSFGKMLKKLTQALTSNIGLKITYLTLQPGPLTKILANIKSILKTLQHYNITYISKSYKKLIPESKNINNILPSIISLQKKQ